MTFRTRHRIGYARVQNNTNDVLPVVVASHKFSNVYPKNTMVWQNVLPNQQPENAEVDVNVNEQLLTVQYNTGVLTAHQWSWWHVMIVGQNNTIYLPKGRTLHELTEVIEKLIVKIRAPGAMGTTLSLVTGKTVATGVMSMLPYAMGLGAFSFILSCLLLNDESTYCWTNHELRAQDDRNLTNVEIQPIEDGYQVQFVTGNRTKLMEMIMIPVPENIQEQLGEQWGELIMAADNLLLPQQIVQQP